jgi:hypothetical protein
MRRMGCVCRREGAHRSTFCVGVDERAGACACGVGLTPQPSVSVAGMLFHFRVKEKLSAYRGAYYAALNPPGGG